MFQGRDFYGDIHLNINAETLISGKPPQQVPGRPEPFVNREEKLAEVDRLTAPRGEGAGGAPAIVVLRGAKGVGKSAFGRYWAHVNANRFRDGQLYVDFREHRHAGASAGGAVLGELLRSLGLRDEMIPVSTGERAKLFRTETAKKQLLLLLDDARQASEVAQLLPTNADSVVMVTTNESLRELFRIGARPVDLPPLQEGSAEELLASMAGDDRVQGEPSALARLVELCDGLPIALTVCGERLIDTGRSVEWLVESLEDDRERLAELDYDENLSLRAVFDQGYGSLSPETQVLHRRLGLLPSSTVTPVVGAAAIETTARDAAQLLDELSAAWLIEEVESQRFRHHDLLHTHARVLAAEVDTVEEQEAAIERVVDYYVGAAQRMDRAIAADRLRLTDAPPPPPAGEKAHETAADALAWFEAERSNLLAILRSAFERELDDQVWQIGEAVWLAYRSHGHWAEAAEVFQWATEAARRVGNKDAEARMLSQLARARMELGDLERAMEELNESHALMEDSPNRALAASIIEWTGVLQLERYEFEAAVSSFEEALSMFEQADVPRGVTMQRYLLGRALIRTGDRSRAVKELRTASACIDPRTDQFFFGRTLWRFGEALAAVGEAAEAREKLEAAIAVLRRHSAYLYEAQAHESLAALERQEGNAAAEAQQLEAAFAIYTEFRALRADEVMARLVQLQG